MTTTKRITVTRSWGTAVEREHRTLGERAGAIAAAIILALLGVIVIGGLVLAAEAIWRAVL